ncbi:MAG TPA: alkaline phosphatase family protein [Streptosporangiaceae bacterium]|nr:alkaline phosphatase family protein [Streptosporangiaceae bacterium]
MEVNEGDPAGAANLAKVDHVVVVMLENRSFDHMLGYLSLTGRRPDIDGLRPGLANQYQGRTYPAHHLAATALDLDPDHSAGAIDQQIAGGNMSGFVASAAATLAARGVSDGDPGCVMGYYDDTDVPVYDHLAEEFAVCDRWFASVPGATLPNRLYALSGAAAGSRDDRPAHIPPLYHQPSFVRHLDAHDVTWRWYSFDPGTLRLADVHYRLGHHDRFGYFSKTGLPWKAILDITCNQKIPSFLEDAAAGTLRSVSWIDPAFTNFNPLGLPVNDDHPPADIKDGQDLVLAVYDALAASPQWERSLLVIVYDEHGGFYDHVPPPASADDEPEMFGRYGVRVPAIIVAVDRTARRIAHPVRSHFDHQNDPVPLLPRRPAAAPGGGRKAGRAGPGPAIPRLARGPGQPSGGTTDTHHSTGRPAPRHPGAASRGQGRRNRNQPGQPRAPGGRRPSAQRPPEEHPGRDPQTESGWAPVGRTIDGPRVPRPPGRRDGWRTTGGADPARVPGSWPGC